MRKNKFSASYMFGYDSIINGANDNNCHFSNFSNPEKTRDWEKGRDAAIKHQTK